MTDTIQLLFTTDLVQTLTRGGDPKNYWGGEYSYGLDLQDVRVHLRFEVATRDRPIRGTVTRPEGSPRSLVTDATGGTAELGLVTVGHVFEIELQRPSSTGLHLPGPTLVFKVVQSGSGDDPDCDSPDRPRP